MERALKPGLLVSLHTRLSGGVSYRTQTIEAEHTISETATKARWETTKITEDAEEHKRAVLARATARNRVTAACRITDFGLLCPQDREQDLTSALSEARSIAATFNQSARYSRIDVYAVIGRIAADDVEATRAIAAEIARACEAMERAISAADPTAIRESADKARTLGAMLDSATAGRLEDAISEARAAAREITRRVGKAGESAAAVALTISTDKLQGARMAFLDIEDRANAESLDISAASLIGRAVDDGPAEASPAPTQSFPTLE